MKKLLALLLVTIFVLTGLAACGTKPSTPQGNDNSTPSQVQNVDDNKDDTATETPETPKTPETPETPNNDTPEKEENKNNQTPDVNYAPGNNYFLNENNNFYDKNAVLVRPKYVYWHDGKLVAQCFVVNGFDHPVFNINVKKLSFSNKDGLVAEGAFGKLNGVTLQPYTHVEWTFTFSADCIAKYGADITELIYRSSVDNNF